MDAGRDTLKEAARSAHLTPWQFRVASPVPQVGHIYGLGVAGYWGSTIEIEAVVYPLGNREKGTIHFNDTAGSMARDSVTNASSVVRMITGKNLSDYDVHVNVVGEEILMVPLPEQPLPVPSFRHLQENRCVRILR